MRTLASFVAVALIAFILTPLANAFIDTDALDQSLKSIERGLKSDGGLESLVEELEAAAQGDATAYLQVTIEEKTVTMWDIPKKEWFYPHVLALIELGIVSGYKDAKGKLTGLYGPSDNVTREQALKIALNSAGVVTANCTGEPASTKVSDWARPFAVCAASMNFGIKAGTDLKSPASRAETLHYVLRAFGMEASEGTPSFADSASHMYKNDIAFAASLGIVSGNPDGTFDPNGFVNRAAAAKMAKLAIELL